MAAIAARGLCRVLANCPNFARVAVHRCCSDKVNKGKGPDAPVEERKLSGFAKSFQREFKPKYEQSTQEPAKDETFASLLRNSKFVELGDPRGKVVIGTIYHTVGDDLYIDFGFKFPCVCVRPARNGGAFVRGAKVRLRANDLELSTRFLGSDRDMTLLEADCTLLGLVYSPAQPREQSVKA